MNYDILALLYDRIMSHVRYDYWYNLIKKICKNYYNETKPSIFEIGGGTGSLAKLLIKSGFPYYGSDYSLEMCKVAREKGIPFICANALNIPLKNQYSLIIFLYDGINYLQTLDEYRQLFKEVYTNLADGGYFLFDITTEINSMTNFFNQVDAEDFGDSSYIRNSYYDKKRKLQHNDFTFFLSISQDNSIYFKKYEYHIQKVFSVPDIQRVIPKKLFTIEGVWDNFSFKRHTIHSERIHFLIKKI